jgi:alpha-tubulin suppressor-like RCC1 family protein
MRVHILLFGLALSLVHGTVCLAVQGKHTGVVGIFSGPRAFDTCALMADARLVCWGYYQDSPYPQNVGGRDVSQATVGEAFVCAVTRDTRVFCWGIVNDSGQLGTADSGHYDPLPVQSFGSDFNQVLKVSAGRKHVCALRSDHSVWCWGSNEVGQLGNVGVGIGTDYYPQPVQVRYRDDTTTPPNPALTNAVDIFSGYKHSCALFRRGSAACWGYDNEGELGNDKVHANFDSPQTVLVQGSGGDESLIVSGGAIVAGGFHTCGLVSDIVLNSVGCWGNNLAGQLGTGDKINKPTAYSALDRNGKIVDARSVAAGESFTCALRGDATATCWGSNDTDQIGNPSGDVTNPQLVGMPVLAADGNPLDHIVQLAAGASHICALRDNDDVLCWGDNTYRQLDGRANTDPTSVPQSVVFDKTLFTDNFDGN